MKKTHLKPYIIHILPVPAVSPDAFDLPMEQNALISCTDRSNRFLESGAILHKLILPFPDAEIAKVPGAFNGAHARAIIRFLRSLPDSVTDLYVCCSKGGSRSPALAAALLKGSGRRDDAVWKNPFYVPNTLVYKRMCKELGFFMPGLFVRFKKLGNILQYKKAQKRGDPGEWERWKLLF